MPLAGFLSAQQLPLNTVTPAQQTLVLRTTLDKDTWPREYYPDLNYGAEVYWTTNSRSDRQEWGLLERDLTATLALLPAGYSITSIMLGAYYSGYLASNPTSHVIKVREFTHSITEGTGTVASATDDGAEWNHHDGVNDWTGGHDGGWADSVADGEATIVGGTLGSVGWKTWDITTIAEDAIANHSNVLKLLFYDTADTGSTGYQAFFHARNAADTTLRPYIQITATYTPSVPAHYKCTTIIHNGSPTMKQGAWAVNGKLYRFRLPFVVHALDATPAGYQLDVVMDTKKMVDRGSSYYFADSDTANAYTVEFVQESGGDETTNTCKYCTESALGVVQNFHTDHTLYTIRAPLAMSADTQYTFYYYCDCLRDGETSSNYLPGAPDSAEGAWDYFNDFGSSCANLAAFLAEETEWEVLKDAAASDPSVDTTSASILHLTGGTAAKWSGIRVKSTSFSTEDFKVRVRFTTSPGTTATVAGMCGGPGTEAGPEHAAIIINGVAAKQITTYVSGAATYWEMAFPAAPFGAEMRKSAEEFCYTFFRDLFNSQPDYWTLSTSAEAQFLFETADDDHDYMPYIGAYGTGQAYVDYIAVGKFVKNEPIVRVPSVTYPTAGEVFCHDTHIHFPYDTAFTLQDGTKLYWYPDPLAEVTAHPGDSVQVVVRTTSLANPIFLQSGNSSITEGSPDSYMSAADTFGDANCLWDDFTAWADYTEVGSGTWAAASVAEPIFRRADVGNPVLGGQGNRTWARFPNVIKWDTDQYIMIFCGNRWDKAGAYWPTPFTIEWTFSNAPDEPFGAATQAFVDPGSYQRMSTFYPHFAKVFGSGVSKKLYVGWITEATGGGYCLRVASCADPVYGSGINPNPTWAINPNELLATGFDGAMDWKGATVAQKGTTFYVIYVASDGDVYAVHTDEVPENWENADFADDGEIISEAATYYTEDIDCIYDGSTSWYFFKVAAKLGDATSDFQYYTIANANFPGNAGVTDWAGPSIPTLAYGPWAEGFQRSPRLLLDTDFYFYYSGAALAEGGSYLQRWIPNWVGCSKSSTLNGSFAIANAHSKAYLSNTTGLHFAWKNTFTAPLDFEAIVEAMLKVGGGQTSVGLIFRYDEDLDTGYVAFLNYASGTPTLTCAQIVSNAVVALSPAQSYTIPVFPTPRFYPGFPWRLAVRCYGEKIKVGYSAWGADWTWGLDFTPSETYVGDRIALAASAGASYWDRLRVRPITWSSGEAEPYIGQPSFAASVLQPNF